MYVVTVGLKAVIIRRRSNEQHVLSSLNQITLRRIALATLYLLKIPQLMLLARVLIGADGFDSVPTAITAIVWALVSAEASVVYIKLLFKYNRILTEGCWREMTDELAQKAGVRVKRLVLIDSPVPNACAFMSGAVGITTRLVELLTPNEVRAVIAHEIGHIRHGHHRRMALVYSLYVVGVTAFILLLHHRPTSIAILVDANGYVNEPYVYASVLAIAVLLRIILGKRMRRCEELADRVVVDITGDPGTYLQALDQIYRKGLIPARFRKSDQVLLSHPDPVRRKQAIITYARAKGMDIAETVPLA